MAAADKKELNFVVAYPKFMIEKVQQGKSADELIQWYPPSFRG